MWIHRRDTRLVCSGCNYALDAYLGFYIYFGLSFGEGIDAAPDCLSEYKSFGEGIDAAPDFVGEY